MRKRIGTILQVAAILSLALAFSLALSAFRPKERRAFLDDLSFVQEGLSPAESASPIEELRALLASSAVQGGQARLNAWEDFKEKHGPLWTLRIDRRSGLPAFCEGQGIPWVPGQGNSLSLADIPSHLRSVGEVDLNTLEAIARDFMASNPDLFPISQEDLVLNSIASGERGGYLWSVHFQYRRKGVPVEGAEVYFRINSGNLVQFGTVNIVPAPADVSPSFSLQTAQEIVTGYAGIPVNAKTWAHVGHLSFIPYALDGESGMYKGAIGKGLGYRLIYTLAFHEPGIAGTWEAKVDAQTGQILSFLDADRYGTVRGGVFPDTNETAEIPMPLANLLVSNAGYSLYSDLGGHYNYLDGEASTNLANGWLVSANSWCSGGYWICIPDHNNCEVREWVGYPSPTLLATSVAPGPLDWRTSSGTADCATPAGNWGDFGNTRATRNAYYHLNMAKRKAMGWPSGYSGWLNGQLGVIVNNDEGGEPDGYCNAGWSVREGVIKAMRGSADCSNAGEISDVLTHEFGHGLDHNDGHPLDDADLGTAEATGDIHALLYTHNSCLGRNWTPDHNCTGYGVHCEACTGRRDADWRKKADHFAHTPDNFTRAHCEPDTRYPGPCAKEGHCESIVITEALWDMAASDEYRIDPDLATAWQIVDRLFYFSRSEALAAFTCNRSESTWTSDGSNAGSMYHVFMWADDDDGNQANGTPHAGKIFAALNLHGIASGSSTDSANQSTQIGSCLGNPIVAATPSSRKVALSWGPVANAAKYQVLRNEIGPGSGYIPIATVASTSFTDNEVANGVKYYYRVQAKGANPACWGTASAAAAVTPQGGTYTLSGTMRDEYGAPLVGKVSLSVGWGMTDGAGQYHVYEIPGGAYTIRPSARCKTFSPPYVGANIAGNRTIDFQSVATSGFCSRCFPKYYADVAECRSRDLDLQEPCAARARDSLATCLVAATQESDSALNGAILLSVQSARAKSRPQVEGWPFAVAESGDYFFNVVNGDQYYMDSKVSSATVDIAPGERLLGPNELNKNVNLAVKPVHLEAGDYTMSVLVRSQPGSYLTIVISDRDFTAINPLP